MAHHGSTPQRVLEAPSIRYEVLVPAPVSLQKFKPSRGAARADLRDQRATGVAEQDAYTARNIPAPETTEADLRRAARRAAARVRRENQRQTRIAAGTDRATLRARNTGNF